MKRLLPLLLFLLPACSKDRNYTCMCTFSDGRVYSQTPKKDGGGKKSRESCETHLGVFADSMGISCKIYDSRDDFYKCLHTVKWKEHDLPQTADTAYFFPGMSESEKDLFISRYTFSDSLFPCNCARTHTARCDNGMVSLY